MIRTSSLVLVLVASLALGGCLYSNVDENWGKSYEAQQVWQTADQSAPENYEAPEGLDPETSQRVAERYYEGQEEQGQRVLPNIVIESN